MSNCISCGGRQTIGLVTIDRVPVLCNDLHRTSRDGRDAPTGRIDLSFCTSCGHYFNRSFKPELVYYSKNYETSLYASHVFRNHASSLVDRFVSVYGIQDKKVLEIGCGRGDFLRSICEAGNNCGIGFDTSAPFEGADPSLPNVSFVRDYFSPEHEEIRADLIVCQQVLEHTDNPLEFLNRLSQTRTFRVGRPIIYIEVPNGLYTARDLGIWDLIYEHVSYFTPSSISRLVKSCGLEILDMGESFGGQYLYVEAVAGGRSCAEKAASVSETETGIARQFSGRFHAKMETYTAWMSANADFLQRTHIWGAGSKGITFSNLVDPQGRIAGLIDQNPKKHDRYIAGTGLPISGVSASALRDSAYVVVMNPQYTQEIESQLRELGSRAQVVPA
ncbi:class I SAM-dependent methyltransferase [Parahaliea mediterranea]|uniref:Methyltransferase domain-containing protein n=1 Tax=Parahaliea mediterranea TaxID=651086 RepID=A0A939DBL2_9GAMM|nr:class I SAM-dependent methyltransferase [Parahaliea mediterranea]MBN7795253.1 methyltransferase domain-containing protein [Parahaliea mediterranea]